MKEQTPEANKKNVDRRRKTRRKHSPILNLQYLSPGNINPGLLKKHARVLLKKLIFHFTQILI